ncbi:MAG: UPF0175 family protein [Capsulimonadaceae bacterium]
MPHGVLGTIDVEGYRQETLSRSQVGELLSLNFWETEEFLKARDAYLHDTVDDLYHDRASHEAIVLNDRRFRYRPRHDLPLSASGTTNS